MILAKSSSVVNSPPSHIEQGLSIGRQQSLILYKNSRKRNDEIDVVARAATQSQLSDFAIPIVDYNGKNSNVIYQFGIYLVSLTDFRTRKRRVKANNEIAAMG